MAVGGGRSPASQPRGVEELVHLCTILYHCSVVPLPPLPKGIIRIRLLHLSGGKTWGVNWTLNMGSSVTPSVANLNTLAAAVESEWKTEYLPALAGSTEYVETICEWHDGAGNITVGSAAAPAVGGDGGAFLPLSICFVFSYRIAAGYRGGKPRSYISGATQHLLSGALNQWASGIIAAFNTALAHSFTALNALTVGGAACTWGEVSYYKDAAERAGTPPPVVRATPLFRPFTGATMSPIVGHQRLRDRL